MSNFQTQKGFTLLELLVVISIIGLLSSIVVTSLSSAKQKAKVSLFISELRQMRSLMDLEHGATGSYIGLRSNAWAGVGPIAPAVSCDTAYPVGAPPSAYTAQANALCQKIVEVSGGQYSLLVSGSSATFSIQGYVYLPTGALLYCIGSSGTTFGVPYSPTVYNNVGCSNNP